jgi:hypothetical protein
MKFNPKFARCDHIVTTGLRKYNLNMPNKYSLAFWAQAILVPRAIFTRSLAISKPEPAILWVTR